MFENLKKWILKRLLVARATAKAKGILKSNPELEVEQKRVYHALDAARGIAALAVVLYHLPIGFRGSNFGSGDLAVDYFFGLSGFVLAHAYLGRLASGRMTWREFMVARLVRLYPLYALSLVTTLALLAIMKLLGLQIPWSATALAGKLPFAILMLPSPTFDWHAYLFPFTIAAWSILLELGVNLLFAISCRTITRPSIRWSLILFTGALLAIQIVVQDVLGGSSWNTVAAGIPRVCFSFFVGIHIHEWLKSRHEKISTHRFIALLALGVLLAIISMPEHQWIKLVSIFVVFPILIVSLGSSDVPNGITGASLRELGVLSYAIYMMHGPVLFGWLTFYLTPDVLAAKSALVAVPILISVVVIGWMADHWFDRPTRGWITARLRKRITLKSKHISSILNNSDIKP